MNNLWQLQDAKSKFSKVIEIALSQGAQIVTRHGKKTVVILPYEEYERLTDQGGTLAQFLMSGPLAGTELQIERDKSNPRKIDIEL